jgi:hypothetical protein
LNRGATGSLHVIHDRFLGDPGVFVIDEQLAQSNWDKLGHEGVMQHLVASDDALPGMAAPQAAAYRLLHHMLTIAGDVPGLYLFITHDSLVTTTVARLLGQHLEPEDWPSYLEGTFLWREQSGLHIKYRDQYQILQT